MRIGRPQLWPLLLSILLGAAVGWFVIISIVLLFAGGYNTGWSMAGPMYYPVSMEGVVVWMVVSGLCALLFYDSLTKRG